MTTGASHEAPPRRPLRLWPGVVIVGLQWLTWQVVPAVLPDTGYLGALGGLAGGLALVAWWVFFSRAAWVERLGAVALMAAALAATRQISHESIATAGQGVLLFVYAVPVLSLAFVLSALATRRLADKVRRATMVAAILLACGVWALVRTGGVSSTGSDFAWRWSKTPEERLLARAETVPAPPPAPTATETRADEAPASPAIETGADATPAPAAAEIGTSPPATERPAAQPPTADWPGFRGPRRDGAVPGARVATDWSASPPVELWRRPVGPGWSSFAVGGGRLYTQEQRGDDEVVACYDAGTGEPVWMHADPVRFWEANAGAGPRATPTLAGGRVYTLGATGLLNALDAATGAAVWSRDAAADAGKERPYWGFSGSPLVTGDLVVAAVSGKPAAYDRATGEPRWLGPDGGISYSSPQLMTIDGIDQILMLAQNPGVVSLAPSDGAVLWKHAWEGFSIVQPALTSDGDVLISADQVGTRRIAVARGGGGWTVEERWTSDRLKAYFNDFVVHRGHAFGFDGTILACIDLADGERRWKGGRYGQGQLLLLPEQDVLLVLTEKGELALVGATPEGFTELARLQALTGKTWNHPVLVGDLLLVRNDREMAAFRLP